MKRLVGPRILLVLAVLAGPCAGGAAADSASGGLPIEAPQDRPYPGEMRLSVDASDVTHRIVHVEERLSGVGPEPILLYPKWLPGNHSSTGPIERLAGLRIRAGGSAVAWTRDPVDVYAFHVHAAPGVTVLDISFDYLSPTSAKVDPLEMSRDLLVLDWNTVLLYPAGYAARRIPVTAGLRLPPDWKFATALQASGAQGDVVGFRQETLETLVDSPVFAGRHARRFELDPGAAVPVFLDLFADRPELLEVKPAQLEAHRALVQQAYRLFGPPHYAHYDFLYALSDQLADKGLEHLQSSENIDDPTVFTDWDKTSKERDLLPHEFTHSWNGKSHRPADLWTANFNQPMRDSLLWVYEGQTEYWGAVFAARSGMWSHQQSLDHLALTAAFYEAQAGRRWRPLQDTTNDPILNHHRPMSWGDWQRYKDYYDEGLLVWLDVDTRIRERSAGKRSLDDVARAFFGARDPAGKILPYTFEDVVHALAAVEPAVGPDDWAVYLRRRLDEVGAPAPLEGLRRGGYRLVYSDKISEFQKDADAKRKQTDLSFSIGVVIDAKDGAVDRILWDSAAFRAGLTEGTQILAVNGIAYDGDVLSDAIRAAQAGHTPIQLIVKNGERFGVAQLEYFGGLRYPHLERDPALPARLDDIFAARQP